MSDNKIMDRAYSYYEPPIGSREDLMNAGERVGFDVELIPDCDSREDFLELTSLERTIENFERGEYL